MSELRIDDQGTIDHEARDAIRTLLPLLERIGGGSASQVSAGYVEDDGREERLTDMGISTVGIARTVAWDSATYLYEDVLGRADTRLDTRLLDDVQQFLVVAACALDGMDLKGAPSGLAPPWVATCLLWAAKDLFRRADDDGHGRGRDRRSESMAAETEAAKPTLYDLQVVQEVADVGRAIRRGAEAVIDTGGMESGRLEILHGHIYALGRLLWAVENATGVGHSDGLQEAWGDPVIAEQLFIIPAIILALDKALEDPQAAVLPGVDARWNASVYAASEVADQLSAWAERNTPAKAEEAAS